MILLLISFLNLGHKSKIPWVILIQRFYWIYNQYMLFKGEEDQEAYDINRLKKPADDTIKKPSNITELPMDKPKKHRQYLEIPKII